MPRSPSRYGGSTFSFGPGPLSSALKFLIGANVGLFVLPAIVGLWAPALASRFLWTFGLRPGAVIGEFYIWQLVTYMFLHGGVIHIVFNMLALWMFGTELERIWGTRDFLKFYFVTGVGAAVLTVLVSLLPFEFAAALRDSIVIGASGAIYGLLLAYGHVLPQSPDLHVSAVSDSRQIFRDDHGRHRVLFIARGIRRGECHASRRLAGRIRAT